MNRKRGSTVNDRTRSPRGKKSSPRNRGDNLDPEVQRFLCHAVESLEMVLNELQLIAPGRVFSDADAAWQFVRLWEDWEDSRGPRPVYFDWDFQAQQKHNNKRGDPQKTNAELMASAYRTAPEHPFWRSYVAAQKYVWDTEYRNRARVLDAVWKFMLSTDFLLNWKTIDELRERQDDVELAVESILTGRMPHYQNNRVEVSPNDRLEVAEFVRESDRFLQRLRVRGRGRQALYLRFYSRKGDELINQITRSSSAGILRKTMAPCPWSPKLLRDSMSGNAALPSPAHHYILASDMLEQVEALFVDPELPKLFPGAVLFRGVSKRELCDSFLNSSLTSTSFDRRVAVRFSYPPLNAPNVDPSTMNVNPAGCVSTLTLDPSVPVVCLVPVSKVWGELEVLLPPMSRFQVVRGTPARQEDTRISVSWRPRGALRSPKPTRCRTKD